MRKTKLFFYYIANLTTILVSQLSMKTAFLHKEAATKFVWHLGTKDPKVGNVGTVSSIWIKCSLEWWVVAGNDGATYLCRLWESGNATMLTLQDWMVWNPPPLPGQFVAIDYSPWLRLLRPVSSIFHFPVPPPPPLHPLNCGLNTPLLLFPHNPAKDTNKV